MCKLFSSDRKLSCMYDVSFGGQNLYRFDLQFSFALQLCFYQHIALKLPIGHHLAFENCELKHWQSIAREIPAC